MRFIRNELFILNLSDNGGGKIKRKSIMAFLLILTIAMPLSAETVFATTNNTNTSSSQVTANTTNATNVTNQSTTSAANKSTSTTVKAAGSPATTSFTRSQINCAAAKVQTFIETNHRLPSYVTIGTYNVTMPQFLQLITTNLLNINKGLNTSVTLKTVASPSNSTDTAKSGNITKSSYLSLAQSIANTITSTGKAPSYVTTSLGKMNFQNLVYTFSKILNFQNTNNRVPNTVSVKPWSSISSSSSSSEGSSTLRPVYIVSDNINNVQMDNARINALISALAKLGIKAYNKGVGVNPTTVLTTLPKNALLVEILGGADAAYIQEKGTAWYKGLLGDRKDFFVLTTGATKITGLSWLPRAHDDNYSSASFTGIAHPDQYLLKNGISYFENFDYQTSTSLTQLAQAIYNAATS